jgi:putative endonuclease
MYHVYILASRRHGTLYIGVTNSLQKRLEEHRTGKGSSFVKQLAFIDSPMWKAMTVWKMLLPARSSSSVGSATGKSS